MKEINRIATFKDFVGELNVTYKRTSIPTVKINSSNDVYDFIRPYFEKVMDDHEEVKILHLNQNSQVVNVDHHSVGGLSSSVVDNKLILQKALLIKCAAIIVIHNHPSGNLKASNADIDMTKKLSKGCEYVGLRLLDSVIVSRESYFSFGDNGLLP